MSELITDVPSKPIYAPDGLTASAALPMPHVFVIPPEEEQFQTPPWCCFDASAEPEPEPELEYVEHHSSDLQFIDVALEFLQDSEDNFDVSPMFRRSSMDGADDDVVVMSRIKGEKRSSSVLSFINYRNNTEGRQHGARELPEDIIEVVKVRRSEGKGGISFAAPVTKRSKTIRMPFQKAFRSIKNVGKASSYRNRKPHPPAKDTWPRRASEPVISPREMNMIPQRRQQEEEIEPPRPSSPMLTRRSSRRLSQLFTRGNHSSTELPNSVPSEHGSLVTCTTASSQSSSIPYFGNADTSPSVDDLGVIIDAKSSARALSPTLSSKRASRRFSVLDLHRFFTFSSSSSIHAEDQDPSPRASQDIPSLPPFVPPELSIPFVSTASTPSEFVSPPTSPTYSVDTISGNKHQWPPSVNIRSGQPAGIPRDLSFEMRLDSLHFDSLSFDPDDFDVSVTTDGARRS